MTKSIIYYLPALIHVLSYGDIWATCSI